VLGVVLLAGCDQSPGPEQHADTCDAEPLSLYVEVVTADGARVKGATVTATNLTSNVSITSVTNEQGYTTGVNEVLAPGLLRVVATAGSKVSAAQRVEWTCDACHCSPAPGAVLLKLSE
jgi:hypothetical protein